MATYTVGPGKNYATLALWEARNAALSAVENVECYAMNDTTTVSIDGWTTSATNYIYIYAHSTARHAGVWDDSKYKRTNTTTTNVVYHLYVLEDYVRVDGIQFDFSCSSSGGGSMLHFDYYPLGVQVSNCIFRASAVANTTTFCVGVYFSAGISTSATMTAWNCIAYDMIRPNRTSFTSASAGFLGSANTVGVTGVKFYNCTAYNCYIGFTDNWSPTHITATNCIANGCVNGFNSFNDNTMSGNYNCSDIASDSPGANSKNGASGTVSFVSTAAKNFHLARTDPAAKDPGTTNPGSGLYSTDIDGQTRSGSWDIGADEYLLIMGCFPTARPDLTS